MALFDLADVTRTIISLIHDALVNTGHWGVGHEPAVMASLPNRVKKDGLGFYLFHVEENNYYKNFPAPGKDLPPVAFTPMGLDLYYQLSANVTDDSGSGPLDEQLMMGVAMKALHDNPEVPDTTPAGNNNAFRITLQPLSPSEAVQYWTAGESPVKLSAFYQVTVIFLEPRKTTSYAGRVLSYGNYVFARVAPLITASQNTIPYFLPGDPTPRQVVVTPAQAPPADALPAPTASVISFSGSGFGGGAAQLWIIYQRWPDTGVATADWQVTIVSDVLLTAVVRPTAKLLSSGNPVDLLPSLYSARVSVKQQITLPDGTTKDFLHTSNQFPFSVTPRIDRIDPAAGGSSIVTGWIFQHAGLSPDDITVYVGETKLAPTNVGINAGEFRITGATTLELKPPAALPPGPTPIRIMINGVESPPWWITI